MISHGNPCFIMDCHGIAMVIHARPCKPMVYPWMPMVNLGHPWLCMDMLTMDIPGKPWASTWDLFLESMVNHGYPWLAMGFHG